MRVAVILSGFIRIWEDVKKSFVEMLMSDPNVDVDIFIHTYHQNMYEFTAGHKDVFLTVEEIENLFCGLNVRCLTIENRDEIMPFISAAAHEFENSENFHAAQLESSDKNSVAIPIGVRTFDQLRKLRLCNEMRRKYEDRHNFKYDLVMKTRFDVTYYNKPQWSEMGDGNLHLGYGATWGYPEDTLCIANPDIMNLYLDRGTRMKEMLESGRVPGICAHTTLRYIVDTHNLTIGAPAINILCFRSANSVQFNDNYRFQCGIAWLYEEMKKTGITDVYLLEKDKHRLMNSYSPEKIEKKKVVSYHPDGNRDHTSFADISVSVYPHDYDDVFTFELDGNNLRVSRTANEGWWLDLKLFVVNHLTSEHYTVHIGRHHCGVIDVLLNKRSLPRNVFIAEDSPDFSVSKTVVGIFNSSPDDRKETLSQIKSIRNHIPDVTIILLQAFELSVNELSELCDYVIIYDREDTEEMHAFSHLCGLLRYKNFDLFLKVDKNIVFNDDFAIEIISEEIPSAQISPKGNVFLQTERGRVLGQVVSTFYSVPKAYIESFHEYLEVWLSQSGKESIDHVVTLWFASLRKVRIL